MRFDVRLMNRVPVRCRTPNHSVMSQQAAL